MLSNWQEKETCAVIALKSVGKVGPHFCFFNNKDSGFGLKNQSQITPEPMHSLP